MREKKYRYIYFFLYFPVDGRNEKKIIMKKKVHNGFGLLPNCIVREGIVS